MDSINNPLPADNQLLCRSSMTEQGQQNQTQKHHTLEACRTDLSWWAFSLQKTWLKPLKRQMSPFSVKEITQSNSQSFSISHFTSACARFCRRVLGMYKTHVNLRWKEADFDSVAHEFITASGCTCGRWNKFGLKTEFVVSALRRCRKGFCCPGAERLHDSRACCWKEEDFVLLSASRGALSSVQAAPGLTWMLEATFAQGDSSARHSLTAGLCCFLNLLWDFKSDSVPAYFFSSLELSN